ncbi:isochorismatase [Erysipelothrix larvae]|uniref:Isochorismatase n=1 Tax=Erysipelothrix larvae TaxID=1514105 RepID=A0A120JTT1_9FIRM|nr:isochorismatase family cysteine hydrolase [Erysipelothrix larvae]AMC93872.1 isochorismatase [Erysipelothrix larvae]
MKKLLVVVDYQHDFIDGSLGFDGAKSLAPLIKARIEETLQHGGDVVFTRDTHDENYLNTQEGSKLPIKHCIKGTHGWEIEESLTQYASHVFDKPTFGSLEFGVWLNTQTYDEVELCGLVSNICVLSNAVLSKAALPEARIVVDHTLTASFDEKRHTEVLSILEGIQVEVI